MGDPYVSGAPVGRDVAERAARARTWWRAGSVAGVLVTLVAVACTVGLAALVRYEASLPVEENPEGMGILFGGMMAIGAASAALVCLFGTVLTARHHTSGLVTLVVMDAIGAAVVGLLFVMSLGDVVGGLGSGSTARAAGTGPLTSGGMLALSGLATTLAAGLLVVLVLALRETRGTDRDARRGIPAGPPPTRWRGGDPPHQPR